MLSFSYFKNAIFLKLFFGGEAPYKELCTLGSLSCHESWLPPAQVSLSSLPLLEAPLPPAPWLSSQDVSQPASLSGGQPVSAKYNPTQVQERNLVSRCSAPPPAGLPTFSPCSKTSKNHFFPLEFRAISPSELESRELSWDPEESTGTRWPDLWCPPPPDPLLNPCWPPADPLLTPSEQWRHGHRSQHRQSGPGVPALCTAWLADVDHTTRQYQDVLEKLPPQNQTFFSSNNQTSFLQTYSAASVSINISLWCLLSANWIILVE